MLMKKGEVDLIMLRVGTTEGDSMRMKIFRDGTITRRGAGGLPPVTIEATSYKWKPEVFAKLIDDLEPLITDDPKECKEETPNEAVRYSVSFFGAL